MSCQKTQPLSDATVHEGHHRWRQVFVAIDAGPHCPYGPEEVGAVSVDEMVVKRRPPEAALAVEDLLHVASLRRRIDAVDSAHERISC